MPVFTRHSFLPIAQRGRIIHSAKPDRLYEIAERISPGPRIELFARRRRAGWEAWGNQAPEAPEEARG
jgi:N6-adenosine-specific RNA methylase IME4